jgi:hypothetical protein
VVGWWRQPAEPIAIHLPRSEACAQVFLEVETETRGHSGKGLARKSSKKKDMEYKKILGQKHLLVGIAVLSGSAGVSFWLACF